MLLLLALVRGGLFFCRKGIAKAFTSNHQPPVRFLGGIFALGAFYLKGYILPVNSLPLVRIVVMGWLNSEHHFSLILRCKIHI